MIASILPKTTDWVPVMADDNEYKKPQMMDAYMLLVKPILNRDKSLCVVNVNVCNVCNGKLLWLLFKWDDE